MLLIGDPGKLVPMSTVYPSLFPIQKLLSSPFSTFTDLGDSSRENLSYDLKKVVKFQGKKCKRRARQDWSWYL